MSESGFSQSSADEQQWLRAEPAARPIWPWLLLLVGVALVIAARAAWLPSGGAGRDGSDAAGVGTKLAILALEPLTGNPPPVSLANLEAKVTLINFWGPWCGPCAVEFPHLMELEEHFRSEGDFQFFSVSSNYDPNDEQGLAESTAEFLKQQQAEFPTFRDPAAQTIRGLIESAKLEGFGFPTTVVIDRTGIIRGVWVGYRPGDENGMRQNIERLLRNESAETSPAPPQNVPAE